MDEPVVGRHLPNWSWRGDEVELRKLTTEFANKISEQEFSQDKI
jgi:hypothetical protein